MSLSAPSAHSARRHDLDWLRVIAFGVLIFYHIGMFYVTWDWHVKSPHASSAPELVMMLVNPWRLALLFFISGIALRFVTDKKRLWRFAGTRTWRLFLPIIAGMVIVVAPQSYYELRQAGLIEAGFTSFYPGYIRPGTEWGLITPTWNHLWYVVYLMVYTLLTLPLVPVLRRSARTTDRLIRKMPPLLVLIAPVVPFLLYRYTLVPHFETTHNLVWDWANHANSLTIFFIGFVLAKAESFWRAVNAVLPAALFLVAACLGFFSWAWRDVVFESLVDIPVVLAGVQALRVFYAWWVIIALLGLGQRYLNRPSVTLSYMTGMIFVWYILHQTITVTAGYYLALTGLPVWLEFVLITLATIGGCLVGAELIARVPPLRPFFGMKGEPRLPRAARGDAPRPSGHAARASFSDS